MPLDLYHLPGQHNQQAHAGRGGGAASAPATPAPLPVEAGGERPGLASFWSEGQERYSLATPAHAAPPPLSAEETAAIKSYTAGGYKDLNAALRDGRPLSGDQARLKSELDSALAKAGLLAEPVTVLRGVQVGGGSWVTEGRAGRLVDEYANRIGQEVRLPGFQSASFDTAPALDASSFRGKANTGVVLEITTRRGLSVERASAYDDEAEFLMGSNWRYRVTGVERGVTFEVGAYGDKDRRDVIKLEVVGGADDYAQWAWVVADLTDEWAYVEI